MAIQDDRLDRWQQRRTRRLRQLPWLKSESRPDRKPVWYVADEMLVRADHRQTAERVLGRLRHGEVADESAVAPGLIRYRVTGLDVPQAVRDLRARAEADGDPALAASPNHVFMSTPFEHGGPFGPPIAADRQKLTLKGPGSRDAAEIVVVDTGVWRDSPLPATAYLAEPGDYETETDVDADGLIDGDVAHANFIVGVIHRQTGSARTRVVRVLDTFGVCTEADLILALQRIGDEPLVNLSLGAFTLDDQPPLALADALSALLAGKNRLVVAAAGNDGVQGRPFWPAAFSQAGQPWSQQVIAVAAHDGAGICDWSNTGDWVTLAAPGADITSTYVHHDDFPSGWALWSGTSFATPHVVAALAERFAVSGSVTVALREVMGQAADRTFGGHPGLV